MKKIPTYRLKVCQGSVLAGFSDGLHGIDVRPDVLQRQFAAHNVLYFVGADQIKFTNI